MSVDASISKIYMLKYGQGWAGAFRGTPGVVGGLSVTYLCHMSSAFLGTKTRPLCEAFECCQGEPIRGSVGLACHDMFHAFFKRQIKQNLYYIGLFLIKRCFMLLAKVVVCKLSSETTKNDPESRHYLQPPVRPDSITCEIYIGKPNQFSPLHPKSL